MYSNITFKKNRQYAGSLVMSFILIALLNIVTFAQPYINGPLSTGALSGATAAPAGFTWSELQGTNTGLGSGANIGGGFTLVDDFTVPVGQTWNTTKITFFAYSTNYVGATSPFNDTRVQIFSSNPSVGAPVPVFGNLTTNRFLASSTANMYRIGNGTPGTTRQIWKIEATVAAALTAGTYWLEWQHGTIAVGGSNFSPAKTVVGQPTQAGNNALQHTIAGNTWAPITDAGGPQDFPFQIDYTATGAACTAVSPGATTSVPAAVCPGILFNLSVATPGSGIGLAYQWQRSNDNVTYTDIGGATSPTLSTSQTVATWYRLRVTCGANAPLFSTPVQSTMSTACYCIPSALNCGFDDFIANVNFAGINNNSACSASGGYTNFTTTVAAGTPFVGASNPISVRVGPGGTEHVGVWIDYNQNGIFDAAEFTYVGSGNGVVINGNIAIPATALLGTTRMRVRVQWNTAVNAANSCTQTSGFGEVEDYLVNIIPCVPVAITTQPANASVVCGGTTTFTTAASGSIPAYAWQFRASATDAWQNVVANATYSNVNTAILTVATNSTLNGYQYRSLVSGACSGFNNSNVATLTVNPLAAIVSPTAQSICAGSNTIVPISIGNTSSSLTTTFSSAANLALPILENGTGVTNVINAALPPTAQITDVKVRFNIAHTWGGDLIMALRAPNGQVYNLSYALNGTDNGPGGFTNTVVSLNPLSPLGVAYPLLSAGLAPFTNTFKADGRTAATATPLDNGVNNIVRPTGPTGFTATTSIPADIYGAVGSGNGGWTLALYDFYDDGANGGNINRLINWSMDITYGALANGVFTQTPATPNTIFTDAAATIAYTGTPANIVYVKPTATTTYNVAINTGLCTTSGTVVVTVNSAPVGSLVAAPVTVCNGRPAAFSFTGLTGGTGLTYQWQVSTLATPAFTNISGATSATYTIANPTVALNGNKYRVIVSAAGCVVATALTSTESVLTVNPTPVVTISAAPIVNLFPGLTSTLTAAVSPTAVATYQWVRSGVNVTGATGNRHIVNIDGLGDYTVIATDVNGCSNTATTPSSIKISDSATNDILFIYPSPNNGRFQVRYYIANNFTNSSSSAFINVYDEKGARVFTRQFTPGLGYGQMNVDLGTHGRGVYRVDLLNSSGERLQTGSVMVF